MARQLRARGRPRNQRVEALILDSAIQLFLDGGVNAVSFEAISARCGVSRSSIYRRWHTREDVILAALDRLRAAGEVGVEDWAGRPILEVVDLFERLTLAAVLDKSNIGLLRHVISLESGSSIRERYWSAVIQPRRQIFSKMIMAARQRDELPAGIEPDLLQDMLAGALTYRLLMNPDGLDAGEAGRYLKGLLQALGLRPESQAE